MAVKSSNAREKPTQDRQRAHWACEPHADFSSLTRAWDGFYKFGGRNASETRQSLK